MLTERDKVKVLYIAAGWRSGSTLIDNVLGQIDGFFSVGELFYVWEDNLIHNRLCGCRKAFAECGVWRGIINEAYGGLDRVDAHEMVRLRNGGARTRHVPLVLLPAHEYLLKLRLGRYLENLEKLYRAVASSTQSRVVVDSSKLPFYGYLLGTLPSVDLYVVHLVRDPRAVAFSHLRKKFQPDIKKFMPVKNPIISSVAWNIVNLIVEVFWKSSNKYTRLRYEDFVEDPRGSLEHILNLMGEDSSRLPLAREREVSLGVNHTVSGNPGRFGTGKKKLRLDEEWRTKMRWSHRKAVTALTSPLLLRYGYFRGKRDLVFRALPGFGKPSQPQ